MAITSPANNAAMKTLAMRLRALMKARSLTPTTLARKAGMDDKKSANAVQNILRGGSTDPQATLLLKMARALEVSPDYLMFGETIPAPTIASLREDLVERTAVWLGLLQGVLSGKR